MRRTKEVLRLRYELGLGQRQIARSCSIGSPIKGDVKRHFFPFTGGRRYSRPIQPPVRL